MSVPVQWIGSPHRTKGRDGHRPQAVVVHVMEGTLAGTDAWFRDPRSKVSAHYGVGLGGEVHQYVLEADAAWHAGRLYRPSWAGARAGVNPNLSTIGIEHEGDGKTAWPALMYEASAALIQDICNRWAIPIDREHVVCHREIYARKTCPGEGVDIEQLVRMAREGALTARRYNFVPDPGVLRARTRLNVRHGAPTTSAPVARTLEAGAELVVEGWTSNGQSVSANGHWYRDRDGNYMWAGATDRPIPGL